MKDHPERIASCQRLLAHETEQLRLRHRAGLGGRELTRARSYLVDTVVARLAQLVAANLGAAAQRQLSRAALVALGGYGRRELAPCSDVDLMVLRPGRSSAALEEFVGGVLPLLWDVGLEIGHSFRSVAECVAIARDDLHARNAMAEARLITGSSELFQRFRDDMYGGVYGNARATGSFLRRMRGALQERRTRHGEAVCVQEPNVKEGAGGLRDVHAVGWIGQTLLGCGDVDRLFDRGYIAASEHARVRQAYDFISRTRNEAHFQMERRLDVLSLELQPGVAVALGYEPRGGLEPSERFMRDYYRAAQELHRFHDSFLLRTGALERPKPLLPFRPRSRAVGGKGGYTLRQGELYAQPGVITDAGKLLHAFELAHREGVPLSDELEHQLHAALHLLDQRFRAAPDAAARFLALLAQPGRVGPVLRAMHDTGFLARYLPAFQRISLLVQHDHYHRYTVDEHTLRAVEAVDALAVRPVADAAGAPSEPDPATDLLARALREVADSRLLVLGVLLHDIGKGRGGGHVARGVLVAKRVCARLGLDAADTAEVVFLVQKHLVMSQVSQRRDLSDPAVVQGFAETVGTLDRLNMLFVLTYADNFAVAPGAWTSWKAALLAQLYLRARAELAAGGLAPGEPDRRARLEEKVVASLLPEYLRRDVQAFLQALPERYLRAVPPDLIARHFRLVHELGSRALLTDWTVADHGRHTVLSACLRDSPGVLARLAGTLTGAGFDILAVDAFTRSDGIVLDVFTLATAHAHTVVDDVRRAAVDDALTAALEGRHPVEALVARRWAQLSWSRKRRAPGPARVRLEPADALGRTVVEVRADDQPGLVYRITDRLSQLGLDISFAKIATEKHQALDIFYVTKVGGEPVPAAETSHVEEALLEVLTSNWPPTGTAWAMPASARSLGPALPLQR